MQNRKVKHGTDEVFPVVSRRWNDREIETETGIEIEVEIEILLM